MKCIISTCYSKLRTFLTCILVWCQFNTSIRRKNPTDFFALNLFALNSILFGFKYFAYDKNIQFIKESYEFVGKKFSCSFSFNVNTVSSTISRAKAVSDHRIIFCPCHFQTFQATVISSSASRWLHGIRILIDTLATSLTTFANEQAYWLFPALFYSWIIQFYFVHTTSLLTFFFVTLRLLFRFHFVLFISLCFHLKGKRIIFLLFSLNTIAMWLRDNFLSYLYLVLVTLCSVPSSMCWGAHLKHIKELFQ